MFNNIIKKKNNYQLITMLISLVESMQNTILMWLIYQYTKSPLAVSLITFSMYFPMVISSVTFISIIDKINPLYQNYIGNLISCVISFLIYIIFIIKPNINLFIFLIFWLQIIFSFIKVFNKTNFNKINKILFKKKKRNKMLKISLSIIQLFQTAGNIIGNLFVANNIPLIGFLLSSIIYAINFILSYILFKKYKNILIFKKLKNNNNKLSWKLINSILENKNLLNVLIFSIPSSGCFQYLMSTLPFLTKAIKLQSNYSYAILNFCCMFFSSIIGFVIYKNIIPFYIMENYSFFICSILLSILFLIKKFWFVVFINSLCFGLLSGHIICMQINLNKFSSYKNLGKFTILRNSIASLSKILFSFTSVYFINHCSIQFFYSFCSYILFLFHCLIYIFKHFI